MACFVAAYAGACRPPRKEDGTDVDDLAAALGHHSLCRLVAHLERGRGLTATVASVGTYSSTSPSGAIPALLIRCRPSRAAPRRRDDAPGSARLGDVDLQRRMAHALGLDQVAVTPRRRQARHEHVRTALRERERERLPGVAARHDGAPPQGEEVHRELAASSS
jgi:hypothetical protein